MSLAFAPDGQELFIGSSDKECVVLDWPNMRIRLRPRCNAVGKIRASLYSSDGKKILMGTDNSSEVEILDRETGLRERGLRVTDSSVMSLALTGDDSQLACGDSSGHIHTYDFATGLPLSEWLVEERANRRWIWDVRYTSDGQWIVSDGPDLTVAIWDPASGEAVKLLAGHSHRLAAVVLSPDDQLIASGGVDAEVRVWNASTGALVETFVQRMDCRGLRIREVKMSNPDVIKFLIERGATEE